MGGIERVEGTEKERDALWQKAVAKAMILAASVEPQASLEQSRMPNWKLLFLHRQAVSVEEQPRDAALPSMLVMHCCCEGC